MTSHSATPQQQNQTNGTEILSNTTSYANITANETQQKKENAIVFESIEGCTIDEYIDGLELLIDPNHIRFISKISGNRVCVYLSNRNYVDQLKDQSFEAKGEQLRIRPLIERNKRVVVSNVYPDVPHEIIIRELKVKGITPVSAMSYVRAGLTKPGRSHIGSFRRQIYVKEGDEQILPEKLQIHHDGTTYWIYFTTDALNCFLCKQNGHRAKLCPTNPERNVNTETPQQEETIQSQQTTQTESVIQNNNLQLIDNSMEHQERGIKRAAPASSSSGSAAGDAAADVNKPELKKAALSNSSEVFETPKTVWKEQKENTKELDKSQYDSKVKGILEPIKCKITESQSWPLNFEKLQEFLVETRGAPDKFKITQQYTSDIDGLIKMLEHTYEQITDSHLKTRLTKLKKRLILQNFPTEKDDMYRNKRVRY
ncbi:hypothetical protein QAD02_004662 [Eretmocerus hayati]|uniref:Uncharacterized protein n=1 Tax=Eretmocerus hayati TaxID=131215 RepID=A0ACC2NQC7_9HYME|nr:hypothetical protein QAD02_004662 [Eretmocerus hayati]